MRNPANDKSKAETQEVFRRKIGVLQRYIEDDIVEASVYAPKNMAQFREWEDDSLGLRKIGSSGTTSLKQSPHNRALIEQALDCMARLKVLRTKGRAKRPPLADQLRSKTLEIEKADALAESLASEVLQIRHMYEAAIAENQVLRRMKRRDLPPPGKSANE